MNICASIWSRSIITNIIKDEVNTSQWVSEWMSESFVMFLQQLHNFDLIE